jgi:monovalent cation:H+ antiporter, CPA1 family
MELLDIAAVLLTAAAVFGTVNERFFKLPSTIGLMVITLVCSTLLLAADFLFGFGIRETISHRVGELDFSRTLLHGMLCFLLFAGALHVNLDELLQRKWVIGTLATVGVAISTILVGGLSYGLFRMIGFDVPLIICFVFGALISPTDPVAVLGVLKSTHAPASIEAKIAGESLFNDGVGLVVFILLCSLAGIGHQEVSGTGGAILLFLREAGGGALLGLVLGYAAYRAMKSIDHYQVEVIITLALVLATNSIAALLHVSGPIAVVLAGFLVGNQGKRFAMSDETVEQLEKFWALLDDILNAVLFLLIGLELFAISFAPAILIAGLAMIPIVLLARLVSVAVPISILKAARRSFSPRVIRILTWCGLRGGISVALVLSLDIDGEQRELLITCTYLVVLFSVIVQGLSIKKIVQAPES